VPWVLLVDCYAWAHPMR